MIGDELSRALAVAAQWPGAATELVDRPGHRFVAVLIPHAAGVTRTQAVAALTDAGLRVTVTPSTTPGITLRVELT